MAEPMRPPGAGLRQNSKTGQWEMWVPVPDSQKNILQRVGEFFGDRRYRKVDPKYNNNIYLRKAEETAKASDQKDLDNFLASLGGQSTGSGGGGAPAFDAEAYLRELIGQIDLGYAKSVSQLEQGRAGQMQRLMEQQNEFKNLLARNRQTYEQGAAMAAQEIANRATAGQQRATELANQLANAMRLEGVSAQPLQAQAQLQQQLMQESQRYQQDYQTRMNQLAAQRFTDAERSSELIRQGAGGQLENQYRALQTALERQRLQDIMGAQKQVARLICNVLRLPLRVLLLVVD